MAVDLEKARRMARSIAIRRFANHWDRETILGDVDSTVFELSLTAPPRATAGTVAHLSVRRVAIGRHFRPSIRSIGKGWQDKRAKRPKYVQLHVDLTDLAAPDHNPADVAAFRIDFAEWLATWQGMKRAILEALAVGDKTGEVAARFNISPGRVSQLRREYEDSWRVLEHQSEN